MSKVIMVDGKPHRMRRGKLVEIPSEWVGRTVSKQKMRKRESKDTRKQAAQRSARGFATPGHPRNWAPRHTLGRDDRA